MLKAVSGSSDILPQAKEYPFREPVFRYIVKTAEEVLRGAGAQMIHTPIFEYLEVFQKGAGSTSDIVVKKEMFVLEDRGKRLLALRPEPTAAIVRAYNEHGMKVWPQPVRLFTWGPIFRGERPQKGRYRQFHQVDYEALGLADPVLDAEAIALMVRIYKALGLQNFELRLGSVGDPEDRARYNQYLRGLLLPHANRLSPESRARLEANPMRILDSKDEQDQAVLAELGVKPMLEFLGEEAQAFHEQVCRYLERLGVAYTIDPNLVRGLDYYVRTAWEVHHAHVGAKSALGGGGRYDGLSEMLGGPRVPGVGFGIGVERVALALEQEGVAIPPDPSPILYLAPLDEAAKIEALVLAEQLRPKAFVEIGYVPKNPRKALEEALRRGVEYVGFLGENERAKGVVTLKHLPTGEQRELEPLQLHSLFEGPR
ncbi:Histidine--tRNA ligase [Meiothermus luteus]|jgi:histidyl-tRNA synthetase|uniref:Histidine--tRNA ligase n=1 Tax=Meiothermus luteus TaxID=2026184 RepID=A0A399EUW0_9DEIN|nr:histidine--tRNA ligase [Meiothermus luteus]RIH87818.1 Histidine--tRNA ligase [Meiothermus luteus]RMH54922.1 MAG: histidine--tRNA ligase [Deinococcota bacterium]